MLERDVLFTNSAGIRAAPISETVLAMILHFARGLDVAVRRGGVGGGKGVRMKWSWGRRVSTGWWRRRTTWCRRFPKHPGPAA